jgi:hypothetical protein
MAKKNSESSAESAHAARCTAAAKYVDVVKASPRRNRYYVHKYVVTRGPPSRDDVIAAVVAVKCTCLDWEYRSGYPLTSAQARYGCKHMIAVNYATGVDTPGPATTGEGKA